MTDLNNQTVDEMSNSLNKESNEVYEKDVETTSKKVKKVIKVEKDKRGIIYLEYIPDGLRVKQLREILSQYGAVGRIFLQPEKKFKKGGKPVVKFIEGWVEFEKKKVAKQVAAMLNGQQIGGRRRTKFHDSLWSMKYLKKFKWSHLMEQMAYEKVLQQHRLRFEINQAKKESDFYSLMTEMSKKKKKQKDNGTNSRNFKQRLTEQEILRFKASRKEVDDNFLKSIFS